MPGPRDRAPDRPADWEPARPLHMPGADVRRPERSSTMADRHSVSGPVSGTDKTLSFETGKLAQQTPGRRRRRASATRPCWPPPTPPRTSATGIDFFPLTVDVEERAYAAGKIPGSFFRREGRPTEDAILTCRLTDRPLRPSFPDGFRNETQVVDHRPRCRPGEPARRAGHQRRLGGADALGHPVRRPDRRRAHRLQPGRRRGSRTRPTRRATRRTFELVVAGRQLDNGDVAIMMVEAGGTEKSVARTTRPAPRR